MSAISDGLEAAAVVELQRKLPGVEAELERMEDALVARVFKAIEARELSAEQALYAWLELMTYRQLARRLNTRVKVGRMVVEKVTGQ